MSRIDRLHSLVDKGFAALDDLDLEGAAKLLDQARKIDKTAAPVRMLEAAIADADGDPDAAVAIYDELATKHPDDPRPLLDAAMVHLYSREDLEAAIATADRALALIEDDDMFIDAILVKARATAAQGEDHEPAARAILAELDAHTIDEPELLATCAEVALECGDGARATAWLERLTEHEDWAADAWYGLGRVRDVAGDTAGRTAAWTKVLTLDAEADAGQIEISADALERIAAEAVAELPEDARARLANVPILIADRPSVEQIADGIDPRLLGLFAGTPLPAESAVGGAPTLTTIHLFHKNLEASAVDEEDLIDQIRLTVLHETAHFFGLDEDQVAALGLE